MANVRSLQRSFAGGEITPEMFGRIDDAKYQSGLALCRNFIVKPHGPAENRAGFAFVRAVKDSTKKVRLLPFTFSTTQTMVLEMGAGYFRFHTNGETLLRPLASAWSSAADYGAGDLVAHAGSDWTRSKATATFTVFGTTNGGGLVRILVSPFEIGAADLAPGDRINVSGVTGTTEANGTWTVAQIGLHSVFPTRYYVALAGSTYVNAWTGGGLGDTKVEPGTAPTAWYQLPAGEEYEIANPYAEADLFDVHHVQSADVLTLVHPNYAPRELRRLGPSKWSLDTINFSPTVTEPTGVTAVATGHTAVKYTYEYVVTAIGADGVGESAASVPTNVGGNLFETGGIVTVSWTPVAGATRYRVYKLQGGLYGYIGQTEATSLVDDNIAPDLGTTPPRYDSALFSGAGKYPGAVSYFEQRRAFAGTTDQPQNIWMTKSGTESNMSYSLPVRDDDRIAFRVAAREANTIRHIVPLAQLLLLTSSAEWRVTSVNSDAITPTTFSVQPQSYVGASNVQPVIINNTLIYGAARGGHVREMAYSGELRGFSSGDISLRATHLFDGMDVLDMAFGKSPLQVVWCVSSSGKLLGLTYVPEQQIGAWHQHDTDGVFESCTVVAEGREDVLYCVIRRTIDGASVRYVERMASRAFDTLADAFFVDAGATYEGAAVTTISGLGHLEGKTVSILADGAVHPQRVVSAGAVTLDEPASKVHIGLPISADLQTLPVVLGLQDGSFGQGRFKNVNKVWLRVHRSSGVFVGPNSDRLTEAKQRTTEPYGSPPSLKSEEIEVSITPSWGDSGQVFVRQADPLPLTVAAMVLEVAVGG